MFENLSKLLEWLKRLWIPVAGFISAITLIVQFIELWQGNQATATWVTTVLSLIVLISLLIWLGFSKSENTNRILIPENYSPRSLQFPKLYKYARLGLLIFVLFIIGAIYSLYNKFENLNNKVVVLITNFDGPDSQKYRVTEIIWENIYSTLKEYNDVELVLSDVTVKSFSEAGTEGRKYDATIVMWGWYSVTDELARVTIHFDILNPPTTVPTDFINQETMRDFKVGELQNFSVQEQLSDEMTFLSLTTVGLVRYSLQDWNGASASFNSAKLYTDDEELLKETQYFIDLSNAYNIMITPTPGNVLVIFASQNIPQGTIITVNLLSFVQIPSDNYAHVMYSKLEDLIGKYTKFPLDQGVVITETMVISSIDNIPVSGPEWASLIPPGMFAISIPTDLTAVSEYSISTPSPSPTP